VCLLVSNLLAGVGGREACAERQKRVTSAWRGPAAAPPWPLPRQVMCPAAPPKMASHRGRRSRSPARRLSPPLPPLLPRPRRPAAAAHAAAAVGRGPAAAVADQSAAATAPPTDPLPPLPPPRLHARRWTPGALPARGRTALRPAASPAAAATRRTWACVQEVKGVRRSSRVDLRHCRRMLCRQIAEADRGC